MARKSRSRRRRAGASLGKKSGAVRSLLGDSLRIGQQTAKDILKLPVSVGRAVVNSGKKASRLNLGGRRRKRRKTRRKRRKSRKSKD